MNAENAIFKDIVVLRGYDVQGIQVVEERLSWDKYYEDSNPLIDSAEYRRCLKIVKLTGVIFEQDASVSQRFENQYNELGQYAHGKAIFADGTIQVD